MIMRLVRDEFNSSIFGINMANIEMSEPINTSDVERIVEMAEEEGYRHLSVKVDITEKKSLYEFLRCGFILVDTQIMYEISLLGNICEKNTGITRPYDISDKDRILEIAKSAYRIDRFHSDPNLPDEKCDTYYEMWTKNLCEGLADKVFVIDIDDYVLGFTTIKYDGKKARAVLAAVDSRFQGNGYYTALMNDVFCYLASNGYERLYLGTQLGNLASLRTVGRLGGVPKFCNHVLHKMI